MVTPWHDPETRCLLAGLAVGLAVATAVGQILRRAGGGAERRAAIENLNARIRAWWVMAALFAAALLSGPVGTIVLFALISFAALREYITLTPTGRGDHRALFWAFFVILPLHYYFLGIRWYGMFSIFIPVYAFIFLPIRSVAAGDPERFLERTAKIQWGLMVCVYCVSYAPALLLLNIPGYLGESYKLLFFLVVVAESSDVCQYIFGKLFGRRKAAPLISPGKTVEGLAGGVAAAVLVGCGLARFTPFGAGTAAALSLLIAVVGFFGDLTMSAIKRDRGVKDFGTMISGHGGVLDRMDSLCFAAPVFFHLVRFFFA